MLPGFIIGILVWGTLLYLNKKFSLQFKHLLFIIITFGIIIRVGFMLFTPTFYAPDEEPHFNYVKYLYEQKSLPVQTSKTNEPTKDWEYYQPPLYYLILALDYWAINYLANGNVTIIVKLLRLFSIVLSLFIVWFALKILNNLNLQDLFTKTFVVSMVFLIPSYVFISSVINNDNLIIVLASAILFFLTKNKSIINSIIIGLLLGIAFLTKLTAFILMFGVISFHVFQFIKKKSSLIETLTHIGLTTFIALLISLPIFLRNLYLYGDVIGESVANVRVIWPSWIYGALATIKYMMDSFWASAGITYNIEFLSEFSILLTASVIFIVAYNFVKNKNQIWRYLNNNLGDFLIPLTFTFIIEIVLVFRFGLLYEQGQGRFLYILLIPISIFIATNLHILKVNHIRNSYLHILGFFILYNSSFLSYCISYYKNIN